MQTFLVDRLAVSITSTILANMLFATWRRLVRLPELPQYSPHPDARSIRYCYWQVLTAVTVGALLVWGIMPVSAWSSGVLKLT